MKDRNLKKSGEILIREATLEDAEGIAKVHVQAWRESYAGIVAQDFLDAISLKSRLELRQKILTSPHPESIYLVATHKDKIIGFCDAGPSHVASDLFQGEVYAIYLLNEYKHLGIGLKLIRLAHDHLIQKHLTPYIAWVLEENSSACRFYESHGGQKQLKKREIIGDKEYTERGYIFDGVL